MADEVVRELKEWRIRSRTACLKGPLNLVFPTKVGTPRNHSNNMKDFFWPLRKNLGLDLRWHDLRHYAISCWLRQGYTIKEAQTFAGHASAQMTIDRYGHYLPKGDLHSGMNQIFRSVFMQHQCDTSE
ncbi:MAG: tyrosine-type recombinase/integrase [Alphaproteobacteria bacterium]|nr:tyrosine-type recombinase/integrase [Alphaproteobacteria bacterium]